MSELLQFVMATNRGVACEVGLHCKDGSQIGVFCWPLQMVSEKNTTAPGGEGVLYPTNQQCAFCAAARASDNPTTQILLAPLHAFCHSDSHNTTTQGRHIQNIPKATEPLPLFCC